MSSQPLAIPTILLHIASSLPHDSESAPQLKSPLDLLAVFLHASLLSVGFRLIGLAEDDRLDTEISEASLTPLPTTWNSQSTHTFRYAHTQSSMQYLLTLTRLGPKTLIHGLGLGDDKTATLEIITADYLSPSFFPYSVQTNPEADADATAGNIASAFNSEHKIQDLVKLVKVSIIQKLIPSLYKEGYEEELAPAPAAAHGGQQAQGRERDEEPLRAPAPFVGPGPGPARGNIPHPIPVGGEPMPGFEDEHRMLGGPAGLNFPGGRNPLSIGDEDLYPMGIRDPVMDPFRPGVGGLGGGGMHPTADHPMFGGRGGLGGVPGHGRAPPGARYDPVGPGDVPMGGIGGQMGMGMGPRGPRGGGAGAGAGGAPFNPFSQYGSGDFL